jgi:apolipoprotein N-acyltransferase
MKKVLLSVLAGLLLYLPFSKLNLWFLLFPALFLFVKYRASALLDLGRVCVYLSFPEVCQHCQR